MGWAVSVLDTVSYTPHGFISFSPPDKLHDVGTDKETEA